MSEDIKKTEEVVEEEIKEEIKEETQEATVEEAVEASEEAVAKEDAASEEATEESAEGDEAKEKKGLFGKKKDKLQEKVDELNDKVMRQMAEFENYRKRTEKEKSAMFDMGAKSVVEKILPVVDNFERGLAALDEEAAKTPFAEGMNMVYKQLMGELEKMNVKPIEAVGQEFNPDFHQAVMHVEDDEVGENVVVEELQKGYTYNDAVVRYSMVKVAN